MLLRRYFTGFFGGASTESSKSSIFYTDSTSQFRLLVLLYLTVQNPLNPLFSNFVKYYPSLKIQWKYYIPWETFPDYFLSLTNWINYSFLHPGPWIYSN